MLQFEPLCWIYHDTWKWKQTKIIVSPNGEIQDLSKTYTHPGHVHLFFDGKDVTKIANTKLYTGTQDYHFQLEDEWGPNSTDPNQIQSYTMVGNPIWYIYVEQYWRRMYVQSWDYDNEEIKNGIHDGKGGIKYDASKPCHTFGPFRQGAELYFFNTTVNRTVPIEYYLDENKNTRQLYIKQDSNSNNTSGEQIWHFKSKNIYNWTREYSEDADEQHHPQWGGNPVTFRGSKKTSRIYSNDSERYNGPNAKRIHKDGNNMTSDETVNWQAYSSAFDDSKYYKMMTQDSSQRTWDMFTHCYDKNAFESWKTSFENWEKNKISYRKLIDYGDAKYTFELNGKWETMKINDIISQKIAKHLHYENQYSYDIAYTLDDDNIMQIEDDAKEEALSNSWYKRIPEERPEFPAYTYDPPTPLLKDFQKDYDTAFDNEWIGYYEYREIVKYKNKYYRRMWKPINYDKDDFGYHNDKTNVKMKDNIITPEIIHQDAWFGTDTDSWHKQTQYALTRRHWFPNPPPDGLPYDSNAEHDMYWEYMAYFGKIRNVNHYNYYAPTIKNLQYDDTITTSDVDDTEEDSINDVWFDDYRNLYGKIKYHKIDISRFTHEKIQEWKLVQGFHSNSSSDSVSIPYNLWNENEKAACFNKYFDITNNHYVGYDYTDYTDLSNSGFNYFRPLYHIMTPNPWGESYTRWTINPNYKDSQNRNITVSKNIVVNNDQIPVFLTFDEFCKIWQPLTEEECKRLNLSGDTPQLLEDYDSNSISKCFNFNNPLDPFALSNSAIYPSNSAISVWLKKYKRREIYTIPEGTYCKGDFDIGKDLHPYYRSYSKQDGARRLYPDDKFISPIIEYQKIIHKNWELYNPKSYDILHDATEKWKYCDPAELVMDDFQIDISSPFVDIQGNTLSPFSDTNNSPTLPIGQYSKHNLIKPENKMRYHVEYYDSLAQVKKYNLPQYIRLIQLYNSQQNVTDDAQLFEDDYLDNTPPDVSDEMEMWFYHQSNSQSQPYFQYSDIFNKYMPCIPVTRRNDEDTHVYFSNSITFNHIQDDSTSSYAVNWVYRSPTTNLCVTPQQIQSNSSSYVYVKDDDDNIIKRITSKTVVFNDPYNMQDGRWVEQCLGAIVKAKAVIILQDRLGHRWYEQVMTTELDSDTPLRGSDY